MEIDISSLASFPWDRLPLSLQESILSLLPISTLLRCCAASRSLLSLIRSPSFLSSYQTSDSPPQPLFLFFSSSSSIADAYDPLLDRWISLPFPLDSAVVSASDGPLLLLLTRSSRAFTLIDPFSPNRYTRIPLSLTLADFHPIAFISESLEHFKIVMVCACDRLYSKVYDSRTCEWTMTGVLDCRFALVANGVFINGLLYCLSRGPDHLLTFDPVGGGWGLVNVSFPATRCSHILKFDGRLFLVGGVEEEVGAIVGIGVWELDWGKMEWGACCFMPDEVFAKFSEGGLNYFQTVDLRGMICFVGNKRDAGATILMCDLSAKRWWPPRSRGRRSIEMHYCSVNAVEPYIDLVKANR